MHGQLAAQCEPGEPLPLLSLPAAVLAKHVLPHLGPCARAHLRATCRELRLCADSALPEVLSCCLNIDQLPAPDSHTNHHQPQPADPRPSTSSPVSTNTTLTTLCSLLAHSPTTTLNITFHGPPQPSHDNNADATHSMAAALRAMGGAARNGWVRALALHVRGPRCGPALLRAIPAACPNLQSLTLDFSVLEAPRSGGGWDTVTLPSTLTHLSLAVHSTSSSELVLCTLVNAALQAGCQLQHLALNCLEELDCHHFAHSTLRRLPTLTSLHLNLPQLQRNIGPALDAVAAASSPLSSLTCPSLLGSVHPAALQPTLTSLTLLPEPNPDGVYFVGTKDTGDVVPLLLASTHLISLTLLCPHIHHALLTHRPPALHPLAHLSSLELAGSVVRADLLAQWLGVRDLLGLHPQCRLVLSGGIDITGLTPHTAALLGEGLEGRVCMRLAPSSAPVPHIARLTTWDDPQRAPPNYWALASLARAVQGMVGPGVMAQVLRAAANAVELEVGEAVHTCTGVEDGGEQVTSPSSGAEATAAAVGVGDGCLPTLVASMLLGDKEGEEEEGGGRDATPLHLLAATRHMRGPFVFAMWDASDRAALCEALPTLLAAGAFPALTTIVADFSTLEEVHLDQGGGAVAEFLMAAVGQRPGLRVQLMVGRDREPVGIRQLLAQARELVADPDMVTLLRV